MLSDQQNLSSAAITRITDSLQVGDHAVAIHFTEAHVSVRALADEHGHSSVPQLGGRLYRSHPGHHAQRRFYAVRCIFSSYTGIITIIIISGTHPAERSRRARCT